MLDYLHAHEAVVRLTSFTFIFAVFVIWEILKPRRAQRYPKRLRWSNNLGITLLNTVTVRLLVPTSAVAMAITAQQQDLGIFNKLPVSAGLSIVMAVLIMDAALYFQHLAFHHVPFLWRLHRVHHADLDFDVTTGIRFHPLEILLSLCIKMVVVLMLGAPVAAVVIFEVLLNATSVFNHANIYIPHKVDRVLRRLLVTPDMHRVHHSVVVNETNSNFGFNLPWWDYLFGTYRDQPQAGHLNMTIGIEYFRTARELWLDRLLLQPFRKTFKGDLPKPTAMR